MQASGLGFREYVEALEEEQRKIQVFQRELPLCLELVTQAIERCRQHLSGTMKEYLQGQSECSGQTSSEGHVFEEFIPIKRTSSSENEEEDDDEQQSPKPKTSEKDKNNGDKKKSDWMRSVQLWNPAPDPPLKEDLPRKASVMEVNRNGGAFQPFQREKSVAKPNGSVAKVRPSAPATSSTSGPVTGGSGGLSSKREDKEGQRKQRRNWSPELHRRFLNALQQLGGSHAATPKQIRELMKVDGLTNDEVKSHLQKYRLHTRRPSPTIHRNNGNAQTPQIVLVGGIWMPPPEYAAVATTSAPGETSTVTVGNGIYAPVAARPPTAPQATSLTKRPQQKRSEPSHSEERVSHSEGGVHSNSPATSSSTHTTTSPLF